MTNPYEQYMENSVLTATPLELVSMLYRCAIDSVAQARYCLETGDVAGRAKPVTRAFDAITELLLSLDHERGGEVSRNLADLYAYVQHKLLLGHCNQSDEDFAEVGRLLATLKESWDEISASNVGQPAAAAAASEAQAFSAYSY